ncbi:Armadillo helical [Salix suchowensis]|nr:Armadillo helical [Salix suchowensis]
MEDTPSKEENTRVLKVLEALRQASHDLQTHPSPNSAESNSPSIKALLELETESDTILSNDPFSLPSLNTSLASNPFSTLYRKAAGMDLESISRVAGSIELEIQAWIDRECIDSLMKGLKEPLQIEEDELVSLLSQFEDRVLQGFNRELQDLVLKSKIFRLLERISCDPSCSRKVREQCAFVVSALMRFNKDVFVGQVLMGRMIHVLCSLIKSIKSPLVDEIESNVVTLDCVLEIGYFGRREAIEAMLKEGLIKKLVELQRSELGGDLIDIGVFGDEKDGGNGETRFLENHPFASCVARFAVQLEVGEGLRQREKRAFKQEILKTVRNACVSNAEAATIEAEVLWGSSP